MILENFRKFLKYYAKNRKKRLVGFCLLSFIAGIFEFLGVALIYPFILIMLNPNALSNFKYLHLENSVRGGLFVGFVVISLFVLKNCFMIFSQLMQSNFVTNWKKDIVQTFMNYYLYGSYKQTMKETGSHKLYIMENACGQVIDGFVIRILNLITNSIIVFMIITLLLIKFPIPAIVTMAFVFVSIYVQNKFFKEKTFRLSKAMADINNEYKAAIYENIDNVKEIKILSSEDYFSKKFNDVAYKLKEINKKLLFYMAIPPYIIEILIIISMLVLGAVISTQNKGDSSLLIASFAIITGAIFRIAPALNRIQTSLININTTRDYVKFINQKFEEYNLGLFTDYKVKTLERPEFKEKIELKNIYFSYEDKEILKDISLTINKGDFIGIIGLSGAGKTTLVDIITGLLPVNSGSISLDNTILTNETHPILRKLIGYVPQQINTLNGTFRECVGWGNEIVDDKKVIETLKFAQLLDIVNEKGGLNTRASSLSQGQKQRLAIARALYNDPEILIFDEATSSLDVKVENEITEMLKTILKKKTIIAIAHRLSTLKACNKLVYIEDGKIVDIGTFDVLSEKYKNFKELVRLSSINPTST